ncbi:hypothetical protein [Allosphingosinicella sp.]|uniref:hypothetical protein n=1 Tax=Allosphingosinicella sp. TaxID=2823234 RepID=UPI003783F248
MPKLSYEIDGRRWIPISRAAKLLGTSTEGVRRMMGDGTLDWRQPRVNARRFVVDEEMVNQLRLKRPRPRALRSPDPLARPRRTESKPPSGGMFTAHHLRMTLPVIDESARKRKPE